MCNMHLASIIPNIHKGQKYLYRLSLERCPMKYMQRFATESAKSRITRCKGSELLINTATYTTYPMPSYPHRWTILGSQKRDTDAREQMPWKVPNGTRHAVVFLRLPRKMAENKVVRRKQQASARRLTPKLPDSGCAGVSSLLSYTHDISSPEPTHQFNRASGKRKDLGAAPDHACRPRQEARLRGSRVDTRRLVLTTRSSLPCTL